MINIVELIRPQSKCEPEIKSEPKPEVYEVVFCQKYRVYPSGEIYPVGTPYKQGGNRVYKKPKEKPKAPKLKISDDVIER